MEAIYMQSGFIFIKQFITKSILLVAFTAAFLSIVSAQETLPASTSELLNAKLPANASRITEGNIPGEFEQTFEAMLKVGEGKISGGGKEVLAWAGNYKKRSAAANLIRQIQTNFRNANWQYDPVGTQNGVEFFNLYKEGAPRRVVMGFFAQVDDTVVCALMEVFSANSPRQIPESAKNDRLVSNNTPSSAKVVTVDKNTQSVNVMGSEMPPMPQFPALQPKAGKVRGYVKDWSGKPLAGAEIGVRSSYLAGFYSGGQGKTDANGYYELTPPKGSAEIYNAGYQIAWGNGIAALSLHPADGKLDNFVTTNGAIENFVLLPYGITSREKLQENPHLPSTFYGGAIFMNWYSAEENDDNAPPFAVKEGARLEITLTPEGKMLNGLAGQTIVIRKTAGIGGNFRIHNIPLGRYRIGIKANGRPLKINDNKNNQMFGMKPAETRGEASILFMPGSAKASMVAPQHGGWEWVDLRIEASQ